MILSIHKKLSMLKKIEYAQTKFWESRWTRHWITGAWNKYDSLGCNRRFRLGFWCRPKEPPNLLKFSIVFGLHFDQIFQDSRKFELSSFDFDLFRLFCVPLRFDELFSLTENVCFLNRSMAWLFLRSTALFWRII